jgi:hypothetical protein
MDEAGLNGERRVVETSRTLSVEALRLHRSWRFKKERKSWWTTRPVNEKINRFAKRKPKKVNGRFGTKGQSSFVPTHDPQVTPPVPAAISAVHSGEDSKPFVRNINTISGSTAMEDAWTTMEDKVGVYVYIYIYIIHRLYK